MRKRIIGLLKDEEGATMVEYAIMASAIAAVCCAVIASIGGKTSALFQPDNTDWP